MLQDDLQEAKAKLVEQSLPDNQTLEGGEEQKALTIEQFMEKPLPAIQTDKQLIDTTTIQVKTQKLQIGGAFQKQQTLPFLSRQATAQNIDDDTPVLMFVDPAVEKRK